MGVLSFKYHINSSFLGYSNWSFKYLFNTVSRGYRFSYKRYAALLNARIFDDPVATTRVATGFAHYPENEFLDNKSRIAIYYFFEQLVANKKAKDIKRKELDSGIYKLSQIELYTALFSIYKINYRVLSVKNILIDFAFRHRNNRYPSRFVPETVISVTTLYDKFLQLYNSNISYNSNALFLSGNVNILNRFKNEYTQTHIKNLNRSKNEYAQTHIKNLNRLPDTIITPFDFHLNMLPLFQHIKSYDDFLYSTVENIMIPINKERLLYRIRRSSVNDLNIYDYLFLHRFNYLKTNENFTSLTFSSLSSNFFTVNQWLYRNYNLHQFQDIFTTRDILFLNYYLNHNIRKTDDKDTNIQYLIGSRKNDNHFSYADTIFVYESNLYMSYYQISIMSTDIKEINSYQQANNFIAIYKDDPSSNINTVYGMFKAHSNSDINTVYGIFKAHSNSNIQTNILTSKVSGNTYVYDISLVWKPIGNIIDEQDTLTNFVDIKSRNFFNICVEDIRAINNNNIVLSIQTEDISLRRSIEQQLMSYYESISLNIGNKPLFQSNCIFISEVHKEIKELASTSLTQSNKNINEYIDTFIDRYSRSSNRFNNDIYADIKTKTVYMPDILNYNNIFLKQTQRDILCFTSYSFILYSRNIGIKDNPYFGSKYIDIETHQKQVFGQTDVKRIKQYYDINIVRNKHNISLPLYALVTRSNNNREITLNPVLLFTKFQARLNTLQNNLFGKLHSRILSRNFNTIHALKSKLDMKILDFNLSAEKIKYSMLILKDNQFIDKIRQGFELMQTNLCPVRQRHALNFKNIVLNYNIAKNRTGIALDMTYDMSIKDSYYLNIFNIRKQEEYYISKVKHGFSIYPWMDEASKDRQCMNLYRTMQNTAKERISMVLPLDNDMLVKEYLPVFIENIGIDNWDNVDNIIVWCSKIRPRTFINNIELLVMKSGSKGFLTEQAWATSISKQVFTEEQFMPDILPKKGFIDYQNKTIVKSKIYGTIFNNDAFVTKFARHGIDGYILALQKLNKRSIIESWISGYTIARNSTLQENIWTRTKTRNAFIYDQDFVTKCKKFYSYDYTEQWLEKLPKLVYYTYGVTGNKKSVSASIEEQIHINNKTKPTTISFVQDTALKKPYAAFFADYLCFTTKLFKNTDVAMQLDWMEKVTHECGIHPDDFGNWAWVYETPPPIDPMYGIDELLLPENDIDYSDFQDIIFDKKHMRPKAYIKQIDSTTFIAKYPVKHPIDDWSDVGINYDASAVNWDNYYGIETKVMYDMFLKFYRIWEKKMFEFATMTIQQSVNKMLSYLYAWIPLYYPVEKLEQAYRVFRLIRWYGETAIIHNSQYIVSYEYDTLRSNLHTGTCDIPNDLSVCDPSNTNDTMIIDSSPNMCVIRNNPLYLNNDVAVEFYIDNPQSTKISFALSNNIGSVNIYLNDKLIDVKSSTCRCIYNIPYTMDTNTIRIEKTAINNQNDQFMIGDIRVDKMSFSNLSIEFDPKLRAGNKPLDEIAKKMIAYANLHDDRRLVYEETFKNNLGIDGQFKRMLYYWNLHHTDKTKGKRLTIKET